jgi:hypothetical protein
LNSVRWFALQYPAHQFNYDSRRFRVRLKNPSSGFQSHRLIAVRVPTARPSFGGVHLYARIVYALLNDVSLQLREHGNYGCHCPPHAGTQVDFTYRADQVLGLVSRR